MHLLVGHKGKITLLWMLFVFVLNELLKINMLKQIQSLTAPMNIVKVQLNIEILFFSLSKDLKAVILQFTWDSKKDTGCTVCLTAAAWVPFSNFTEQPPKQANWAWLKPSHCCCSSY